ncbi:MFS transporter [Saccharothrix syringae]|uniref:MFS transporter n=1 Tax=Saccharothrix syringae TaxID=103733 RepID=A0A5Q0GZ13_SACSY|nr:MFS transporter [Saccharothrix syringae]QFZ19178.1 MFS transporter [Saccharothrix syringae]
MVETWLRRLMWGRGVSAAGDGLWFTTWALYFTRVVGLPPVVVGVAMAVAGGAGLAAAVPLGALADRFDARHVAAATTGVRGLAVACYPFVDATWAFVLVTVVFVAPANGGNAARTALLAGLVVDDAARVDALARQRVAQHVGYAAGAGGGALVLGLDDPAAYHAAIAVNAAGFAVLVVVLLLAPRPRRLPRPSASPLRDRPYLAVVGTTAVLSLCWAMLSTGVPLWTSRTLPLSLSGVLVVVSSVGIALLQVPATRLAGTTPGAARTAAVSGAVLAAACLLLALSGSLGRHVGVAVVVVAGLLHLAGELGYVAASWQLSLSLMREEARGAYQGVAEAATATVQMVGPAFFTVGLTALGAGGWLLAAGVFLAAGAAVPGLVRRADRQVLTS